MQSIFERAVREAETTHRAAHVSDGDVRIIFRECTSYGLPEKQYKTGGAILDLKVRLSNTFGTKFRHKVVRFKTGWTLAEVERRGQKALQSLQDDADRLALVQPLYERVERQTADVKRMLGQRAGQAGRTILYEEMTRADVQFFNDQLDREGL